MLRFFRKSIISSSVRRFYVDSNKIFPHVKNNYLRPANYSNVAVCANPIPSKKKYMLPYSFTSNLRYQHNEVEAEAETLNHIKKFEDLLRSVEENQNDLSVDVIMSYIEKIETLLDDLLFEQQHGPKLLQNKSFTMLFEAIDESVDQMSLNDIRSILNFCKALHISFNVQICLKMIKRLKDNFEDLDFAAKVDFWFFLSKLITSLEDKTVIQQLIDDVGRRILNDIKREVYLNSSDDIAAALLFTHLYYFTPNGVEVGVLSAVLGLKNWDSRIFFRYFFRSVKSYSNSNDYSHRKKFYDSFLKRIEQEIICNHDHQFLHEFLISYAFVVDSIVDYDKNLVNNVISKLLASRLKIEQIRITIYGLQKLRHSHHGFTEYFVDFLKRNSYIYVSHPLFSSSIIGYIAAHNCFHEDNNRLAIVQSILRDNPNLINMLKFKRDKLEGYLYSIIDLASLEIFIDEELDYLSGLFRRKQFSRFSRKIQKFLLNLNQGVKVLHPDFSKWLLSRNDISIGIRSSEVNESYILPKRQLLKVVKNHLEVASGVTNCVLQMYFNKLGYQWDGLVAVNSEGQFYDFGVQLQCDKEKGVVNFLEDVFLPTGFDLVALLLIFEKEHARNTLDLKANARLRLKINERLGFPTVLIYESIFKELNDDEKGNYLHKMILEKMSKKNEAKNFSM